LLKRLAHWVLRDEIADLRRSNVWLWDQYTGLTDRLWAAEDQLDTTRKLILARKPEKVS
jgi:hypothetical protein